MTAWYDDPVQIAEYLRRNGLEGLRTIVETRTKMPLEERRSLSDLIVLRRFVLKPDGLWRILDAEIREGRRVGYALHFARGSDAELEMRSRQRLAMTMEEAGEDLLFSCTPTSLPDRPCDRCHGQWKLDNVHEARDIGREPSDVRWRHASCEQLRQIQDGYHELRSIVDQTPFKDAPLRLVPNQYWPDAPSRGYPVDPWAILETSFGEIRIGWRKRVIHIDWDRAPGLANVSGNDVVADSNTTHGATMVHCWGIEKAEVALHRLYELGTANGITP